MSKSIIHFQCGLLDKLTLSLLHHRSLKDKNVHIIAETISQLVHQINQQFSMNPSSLTSKYANHIMSVE